VTDAYVFEALRSPRTKAKESGGLHELTPSDLLARLYDALVLRTQVDPASLSEVILGCVTQQGEQAANIAKTSALGAGWPASVAGMTINRFCSSSIDAIALAAMKVNCGHTSALAAGGVEMMSRVPLLADGARVFADHDFGVSHQMLLMGAGADLIASRGDMSREDLDAVAFGSHQRALRAQQEQRFSSIVPIATSKGIISTDECVRPSLTPDRLAAMPAVFDDLGKAGSDQVQLAKFPELKVITHLHTAANSPAMCDAAAVLMIGSSDFAERQGLRPIARIVDTVTCCAEPLEVVSGCVEATKTILERNRLLPHDVDVFEIHEAFAATIVKLQRELAIDEERLNVNGGCIALGHPMGATGAIMAGTALDELTRAEGRLAVVAASGAGGTGSALLLERCD
jgi:acetyl-CoA C-acetyltransferase